MASGTLSQRRVSLIIFGVVALLIGQTFSPVLFDESAVTSQTDGRNGTIWIDGGQAWPQFGRTPGHESVVPPHAPPNEVEAGEFVSITDPVLNWRHFPSNDYGVDSLGVPIGDFRSNIDTGGMALDSCASNSLSPIFIHQKTVGGTEHVFLRIIDGDTSQLMWEVDIGALDGFAKATPIIVDIEDDGVLEVLVAYDVNAQATVELWSPDIECDVTGWKPGGSHETERLWRWTHDTFQFAADTTCNTCNHPPVAQPLIADLQLDGSPELVLALLDDLNNEPNVVALPLPSSGTPSPMWEVTLDKGTHPSDPAWVAIDAVSSVVLITTIDHNDGNMWVWRLGATSGSPQWNGASLGNLDGDTNVPHVRLPGPIITQLDSDPAPEMIVTIPSDLGGSTTADGAEFVGLEVTDASEVFSFSVINGYADAPPTAIDTDDDGITDRVCWNTWYRDGWSTHGMAGCHNIATPTPIEIWHRELEGSSGTPNDEIAVAAPTPMNIDGTGGPEILVSYGRTLHALDGEDGSASSVNNEWVGGIDLPHRTWAAHALADVDGDGALDLLIGDMLISQAGADVRPFEDGRAITFNPSTPDPNELVTVTGYFENAGTASTSVDTFARMYVDDVLVHTHREGILDPVSPTGNGQFGSFTFDWSGGLGNHTFSLRLDEHANLTQSRTDNDNSTTVLTIIAPYNVSIGVPTDPVRVLPGSQEDVQPLITSTGRLDGSWTMTIDDSGLPTNWTITDLDPAGSTNVQIDVGGTWSPTLRVTAPPEALGTDAGFVTITMTLDSDANVTQTAILAIEAERTRGLSVRGPDGTGNSNGFGIPGSAAAAWILVENLGNAPETVALQWNSTAWGNDLTLHDSTGTQVNPLTLQPTEIRELTARLDVPAGTTLGNSVSTQLTLCIGAGQTEECSSIDLTFVANQVQVLPPHIRSVPADDRSWAVEIQLPIGVSDVEWDMATAGMIMNEWSWSASGALTIDGTTLRASGNPGARITGVLEVDMPYAAPPMLHEWTSEETNHSGHSLALSMQVLQIHRAIIEITSPTEEPHRMDVEVTETLMLRLSNPGNGPDVYDISWSIVPNSNFTEDPGLTISITSSQVALGAGELRSVPVQLTLPEDMAAAIGMELAFEMSSQGDLSVNSIDTLLIEARQDHQWDMVAEFNGLNYSNGMTIDANPNDILSIILHTTNSGNLIDDIILTPSISVQATNGDAGIGWTAYGGQSGDITVNETGSINIGINVSASAWKDTVATISFNGLSDDVTIDPFVIHVNTMHVPGWWILAGGADLDIDRNGANITLVVEQRGNSPATPFVNGWVDTEGWMINLSQNLPQLDPGESANFTCGIIPPSGAISGHTVELTLSAKNGDGSGEGQTTLPLRVAAWHDYTLTTEEVWTISSTGGLPLAMLSNHGNAPTTIDVEIIGMPEGWTLQGPTKVSLGVGESAGIPISAIPTSSGTGFGEGVTIRTIDEMGTQRESTLTLTESDRSWATSPVLFGTSGDALELEFNPGFEVNSVQQGGNTLQQTDDGGWLWTVPISDENGTVTVDGTLLEYWARVRTPPSRMGSCSVFSIDSSQLASCTLHNGTDAIDWTAILRDENGFVIDLVSGHLNANTTLAAINLSGTNWNPTPGQHTLRATLMDGNGALIAQSERDVLIRDSQWNIGITAVELRVEGEQQHVVVSITRTNQSKLANAVCNLQLSESDGAWTATHRVAIAGELAPQIVIDRPPLEDGRTIDLELRCSEPWDVDQNPDDDTGLIILANKIVPPTDGLDYPLLIGGVVVMFGVMSLLGMIRPEIRTKKIPRQNKPSKSKRNVMKERSSEEIIEVSDDIFIDDEEIEQEVEQTPEPKEDIDVVEESATPMDEFESRLQRLRQRREGPGGA